MNYLYNQQNKLSNCFILSNYVMNLDLSATALAIYCYLMYIEDRKNYECYPSYKTIGKALKIKSKNTVAKYVAELEEKCLISTEPTEVVLKNGKKALNNVKPILAKNIYEKTCAIENYSTRANKVFVKSGDDMRLRREFWSKAIAETSALLKDMEKAMVLCDIPSKVMNFWTGQVRAIQDLLMNRRNTEHKTYMG